MAKLFQIKAGVQSYDWGKLGMSSSVAQFAKAADSAFDVGSDKPYAELWMGTHPKVPSIVTDVKASNVSKDTSLRDLVSSDASTYLGSAVADKFGPDELPFLFKVLSIRKALSIQAHPDKALGAVLHRQDPAHYPDPNHKPEMAIAITDFEGFCGFRPLEQISAFLDSVPELSAVVGPEAAEAFKKAVSGQEHAAEGSAADQANRKALQALFGRLMTADGQTVALAADKLVARARTEPSAFGGAELAELLVRLNGQFPQDIGLFCGGLLLNYVKLPPGGAMFLRAKDPHAYISGDIIECMAASDNVVRAGFTPKFIDVKNLVDMLTYSYAPVEKQKMKPQSFARAHSDSPDVRFALYDPPIDEFAVLETVVPAGASATIKGVEGPSIIVSTAGTGTIQAEGEKPLDYATGFVFFIAPGTEVKLSSLDGEFTTYRAFVEV